MRNFQYRTPTKMIFGQGVVKQLPEVMESLGHRVLLCYGGGSIKKSGLYDEVIALLKDFTVIELSGIEPNPRYSSVQKGVELCREHQVEVILAVGGGSVIDCAKVIAAGALYEGEAWDFLAHTAKVQKALPLVDILTLAATGSEFDGACVISRPESCEKTGMMSPHVYPTVSLMDPCYTYTVSPLQTAAACADAMSHVMEQYFVAESTMLNDGFCEATLKSLMANTKKALANPLDYTARAELMQACAYGCNGILSLGNSSSRWPCHGLEHALSGFYDIAHGVGLAIVTPRWMEHVLNSQTIPRFAQYGRQVFGLQDGSQEQLATQAIQATYDFFEEIGLPMHLTQVGIDDSRLPEMAQHIADTEGLSGAYCPLEYQDILQILQKSL